MCLWCTIIILTVTINLKSFYAKYDAVIRLTDAAFMLRINNNIDVIFLLCFIFTYMYVYSERSSVY